MTRSYQFSWHPFFLSFFACQTIAAILLPDKTESPRCLPGFFPCNGTHQCVEQRQNCDKILDCPDGSDEWNCEDRFRKDFWNNLFRKRPDEDREKQIEGCSLSLVPKECRCSNKNLYCEHRELNSVPSPLSRNTIELDLSGNKICRIQREDFSNLGNVQTLILTSSEIRVIEVAAFQNLPNLKFLYLTGNKLNAIRNATFLSNVALELLVLSHNPLNQLHPGSFLGLRNIRELDLRSCQLHHLDPRIFNDLVNLQKLFLDENHLIQLPHFIFGRLQNLVQLSLSKNLIFQVDKNVFAGLRELRSLSLAYNKIDSLEENSFGNLSALYKLDLQGNGIKEVDRDVFRDLLSLHSLNLKGNDLKKIQREVFDHLQELHYLYFDDFYFCSYAMHVRVCEPQGDGISSVAHLLDNILLRISVWIVAFLACVGNAIVLLGRLLVREPNEVHSFYIKNLALSDLLMGIYLFIIAAYDVAFRGEYIIHEDHWRHSWQCSFSGFLSTTSSEASVFILTIITVDRYLSIMYPLSVKRRTKKFAAYSTLLAWLLSLVFSVLPLLNIRYYGSEFYGSNGVCLPLQIDKPFSQAWEYSTFIFCGVNMMAFFFIFFAYISMFFTISTSRIGLRSTQQHQQQDRTIAQRFAFIVATDFLCWVPIVVFKILSIAGITIDAQLNAWVAVFLLPVNSALNPILYTLTTKLFKQQIARIVYSCREGVQPFSRGDPFRYSRSSAYANQRRAVLATMSNNESERSSSTTKSILLTSTRSSLRSQYGRGKESKKSKDDIKAELL